MNKRKNGFTLLEVVVSLTIFGFIVLIIFGTFRLGISSWERGESIKDESQKLRILFKMISGQIKSAFPYKIKTKKAEGDYLAFKGNSDSLKFISSVSFKKARPEGFVYVIYEFKKNGKEEGSLYYYEEKVLNRDFFENTPKDELKAPLLEGISGIKFEYYREENKDKNWREEWVDEWDSKEEKELPRALRMKVFKKNKKGDREYEFINIETIIPANRFEEIRVSPIRAFRRTTQETSP